MAVKLTICIKLLTFFCKTYQAIAFFVLWKVNFSFRTRIQNLAYRSRLRSMANSMSNMPDDSMQYVKLTGKWNSKTTEDYLEMCQKHIAENKDFQNDLMKQ